MYRILGTRVQEAPNVLNILWLHHILQKVDSKGHAGRRSRLIVGDLVARVRTPRTDGRMGGSILLIRTLTVEQSFVRNISLVHFSRSGSACYSKLSPIVTLITNGTCCLLYIFHRTRLFTHADIVSFKSDRRWPQHRSASYLDLLDMCFL